MKGAPRSKIFDDVYFSAEDGLEEARHVFLDGCGLPEAWEDSSEFVIGETGFGTGLNFLAVWQLFEETAKQGQSLHFISVEKYPLSRSEIDDALTGWDELRDFRDRLVEAYPEKSVGVFEYDFGAIKLTIYFDDVVEGFQRCDETIDAWFLDGFRPSSNPEMWTESVFEQVARLSDKGTRFSTFTSAGFVRRGLEAVGFDVQKVSGFGRKREMSVGVMR